jgi:hypothetical protein
MHADCSDLAQLRARAREAMTAAALSPVPGGSLKRRSSSGNCPDGKRTVQRRSIAVVVTPRASECSETDDPATNPSSCQVARRMSGTPDFKPDEGVVLGYVPGGGVSASGQQRRRSLMAPPPPPAVATMCMPLTRKDSSQLSGTMSARMLYRLQCTADEAFIETECAADDVDWDALRPFSVATAVTAMQNAVHLSAFIAPAVLTDVIEESQRAGDDNTHLLPHFVLGFAQCFQAIGHLLRHGKLPKVQAVQACLENGTVQEGYFPDDLAPCYEVYMAHAGPHALQYAIDAWLRTTEGEHDADWWATDEQLLALPPSVSHDAIAEGDYAALAKLLLPSTTSACKRTNSTRSPGASWKLST